MNIMIISCQIIYMLYNYIFKIPVSNKKIVQQIMSHNEDNDKDEDEYIII